MSTRQLDLINAMIATMGEAPLLTADDGHPYVAAAKTIIKAASKELLGRGWWFNTEFRTLHPDPKGYVTIPGDAIQLDPEAHPTLQPRGRRLYDITTGGYLISANPIPVRMFSDVALEDLPTVFYTVLSHECVYRFQLTFDGDPTKISETQRMLTLATMYLKAEHTRCVKANIHNRESIQYGLVMTMPRSGLRLPVR